MRFRKAPEPVEDTGEDINARQASKHDPQDSPASDPTDPSVTRMRKIEGYTVVRRQPYGHWIVHTTPDGFLPPALDGSFTSVQDIEKAIKDYVGRKQNAKAETTA